MVTQKQFPRFLAPYCIVFEKSVGAIVFHVAGNKIKFLLIKYRNGHWEFPRGHVENNETESDTMKREIKEETNITQLRVIDGFREVMSFSYKAHGQELVKRKKDNSCIYVHKKVVLYLVQTETIGVTISHEHQSFQWVTYHDAISQLTYQNARTILTLAYKKLKNMDD